MNRLVSYRLMLRAVAPAVVLFALALARPAAAQAASQSASEQDRNVSSQALQQRVATNSAPQRQVNTDTLEALALPTAAVRAPDPKPVWIDVPYVHQTPEGCGAAALAMLTAYWAEQEGLAGGFSDGTPAQREQARADRDLNIIARDLLPRAGHGIAAKAMQAYLDQHGFITFTLVGTWHDLEKETSQGRPLIVAVRPRGDPQLHYVVIAGVDPVRSMVILNDPAGRKLITEERAEFEKDWSATHNWLLLAVPETSRLPERMQRIQ